MDLKELDRVDPHVHWYYQIKKIPLFKYFESQVVRNNLKVDIIDIGAGSGFFSAELQSKYSIYVNKITLVDKGYTDEEIGKTKGSAMEKRRTLPDEIGNSFIILIDVLEHVEDDGKFVNQIKQKIVAESKFFITVPAFNCFWSAHDVFLGHYRRYTAKTLTGVLNANGFRVKNYYYLFASILLPALLLRKWNAGKQDHCDLRPVPGPVNFCLKRVLLLETHFMKLNKLAGLSCIAEGVVRA